MPNIFHSTWQFFSWKHHPPFRSPSCLTTPPAARMNKRGGKCRDAMWRWKSRAEKKWVRNTAAAANITMLQCRPLFTAIPRSEGNTFRANLVKLVGLVKVSKRGRWFCDFYCLVDKIKEHQLLSKNCIFCQMLCLTKRLILWFLSKWVSTRILTEGLFPWFDVYINPNLREYGMWYLVGDP